MFKLPWSVLLLIFCGKMEVKIFKILWRIAIIFICNIIKKLLVVIIIINIIIIVMEFSNYSSRPSSRMNPEYYQYS